MKLIGIIGRKRSGKDTIADYLVDIHKYDKLTFAEPIKKILEILFGFDHDQLYGNKKDVIDTRWNISPRKVMQFIGTNIFREKINDLIANIGDNFWVKIMHNNCKKMLDENKKIVISDVRFQNEVDMIRELGGILIKISRDTVVKDIIENNIDDINGDFNVTNDGTIEELLEKIEKLVSTK